MRSPYICQASGTLKCSLCNLPLALLELVQSYGCSLCRHQCGLRISCLLCATAQPCPSPACDGAEGCLEESWCVSALGYFEQRYDLQKPAVFHSGLLWFGSPTFPSGVPIVPTMLPRGVFCSKAVPEPSELSPKGSSSRLASVSPWTSPQGFLLSL